VIASASFSKLSAETGASINKNSKLPSECTVIALQISLRFFAIRQRSCFYPDLLFIALSSAQNGSH